MADNDSAPANQTTYEFWEYLFTTEPGIGWIDPGLGYITGDILIVVLLVMVICASDKVRSSGYFEVCKCGTSCKRGVTCSPKHLFLISHYSFQVII